MSELPAATPYQLSVVEYNCRQLLGAAGVEGSFYVPPIGRFLGAGALLSLGERTHLAGSARAYSLPTLEIIDLSTDPLTSEALYGARLCLSYGMQQADKSLSVLTYDDDVMGKYAMIKRPYELERKLLLEQEADELIKDLDEQLETSALITP